MSKAGAEFYKAVYNLEISVLERLEKVITPQRDEALKWKEKYEGKDWSKFRHWQAYAYALDFSLKQIQEEKEKLLIQLKEKLEIEIEEGGERS